MTDAIDPARLERLVLSLEKAANAFNRLAQALERKATRVDASIKRRASGKPEKALSDAVRVQVERALKRSGR